MCVCVGGGDNIKVFRLSEKQIIIKSGQNVLAFYHIINQNVVQDLTSIVVSGTGSIVVCNKICCTG